MAESRLRNSNRIDFVSWLQFIGVMSVIIGHSMNGLDLPDIISDGSGVSIKGWIYTYHMPLFFLVSAFLFSYKGGFSKGYKSIFYKKMQRLIIPYIIWNILFIIPKVLMSDYISDQVELTPLYFIKSMLYPRDNILGHTWFLFGLFEMYVIAILFEKIRPYKQLWIPVFCILTVINCFGVTERFLAIGDLMKNAVFFWSGLLLGEFGADKITQWLKAKWFTIAILLMLFFTTAIWIIFNDMNINTLLLAFSALVSFVLLQVKLGINGQVIEFFSRNSFAIYILHWPAIMVARFVFYTKLHCNVYLTMGLMFLFGCIVPILLILIIEKINIPVIKKISKYMLGM